MNKIEELQKELAKAGYMIKKASDIKKEQKQRTGLFSLDFVLDGGVSLSEGGHRIEFFGAESSGKTTFALSLVKKFQELDKVCYFIDAEKSYDPNWSEKLGVDNNKLLIVYPDTLEEMGDILLEIIPKADLIVIDSIVGLIPAGEAERDTAEAQMALSARINSLICRKIYHAIGDKLVTMIFINQLREKVGMVWGNPFSTGGGHALKHMYNTRVEFKAGKPIEVDKERVGLEINLNCVKNKKGKPFHKSAVDFYFNGFLDNTKSLFFAGIKYSIITQKGSYYMYKDIKEQGEEAFKALLKPKDWLAIEKEVWERIK
jgi:recombination protein RecA